LALSGEAGPGLTLGAPPEQVFMLDAMANADCVPWFVAFAQRRGA
jgi:acetoacetyl-CoA synthetase